MNLNKMYVVGIKIIKEGEMSGVSGMEFIGRNLDTPTINQMRKNPGSIFHRDRNQSLEITFIGGINPDYIENKYSKDYLLEQLGVLSVGMQDPLFSTVYFNGSPFLYITEGEKKFILVAINGILILDEGGILPDIQGMVREMDGDDVNCVFFESMGPFPQRAEEDFSGASMGVAGGASEHRTPHPLDGMLDTPLNEDDAIAVLEQEDIEYEGLSLDEMKDLIYEQMNLSEASEPEPAAPPPPAPRPRRLAQRDAPRPHRRSRYVGRQGAVL